LQLGLPLQLHWQYGSMHVLAKDVSTAAHAPVCRPTPWPYDVSKGYSDMVTFMETILDYLDHRSDVVRYAAW
jgi:hypothetical protein